MKKMVDYRSDTVTRPTSGMLQAMMQAQVGDDVMGEDPEALRLQELIADMFGMEAALFCPSGTMTNQIALMLHSRPGDEVICDSLSHIYLYEGGGMAANAGIQPRLIKGDRGRLNMDVLHNALNPDDPHKARTRILSIENTSNRGGGSCYDLKDLKAMRAYCTEQKLAYHLDGARIWNAIIAKGHHAKDFGNLFDTISVCLSKSLGAPVGSLLLGTKEMIREATRLRKRLGGGMRQIGYLAAAGSYALKHHIHRLEEDHMTAKKLEHCLSSLKWVSTVMPVETNIVIFEMREERMAEALTRHLKANDIYIGNIGSGQIRMVLHLDITELDFERTLRMLESFRAISS